MRKFIALDKDGNPTAFIPGVPCRDYSEDEWRELVKAGQVADDQKEWTKEKDEAPSKASGKDGS